MGVKRNFLSNLQKNDTNYNDLFLEKDGIYFIYDDEKNTVTLQKNIESGIIFTFNSDDDFTFKFIPHVHKIDKLLLEISDFVTKDKIEEFISMMDECYLKLEFFHTKIDERFNSIKVKNLYIGSGQITHNGILENNIESDIHLENCEVALSSLTCEKMIMWDCEFSEDMTINIQNSYATTISDCTFDNLTINIGLCNEESNTNTIDISDSRMEKLLINFNDVNKDKELILSKNQISSLTFSENYKSNKISIKGGFAYSQQIPLVNEITTLKKQNNIPIDKEVLIIDNKMFVKNTNRYRKNYTLIGDVKHIKRGVYLIKDDSDMIDVELSKQHVKFRCVVEKENVFGEDFTADRTYFMFDFVSDLFIQILNDNLFNGLFLGNNNLCHDNVFNSTMDFPHTLKYLTENEELAKNIIVKKINHKSMVTEKRIELVGRLSPLHSAYNIIGTFNMYIFMPVFTKNLITVLK